MAKLVGYVIAILGLIIIALSKKIAEISFIAAMSKGLIYVIIVGVALIAVGVVLALSNSSGSSGSKNAKQISEEVPIYAGEGKNRKIVGYKRAGK